MIDDAVNEESYIRHEFAHPRRIQSLIDGPLQDVGFSDAFEKVIKVLAVGDETGFVQVASTAKKKTRNDSTCIDPCSCFSERTRN